MALSNLAKFNEFAYSSMTEVLRQQTELFNAASAGAIQLQAAAHQGSFSETAFFQKVAGGLVRRRNPSGTDAIDQKTLSQDVNVTVKVASGTPEMVFSAADFRWIQQSPEQAGAVIGQQLAKDTMADMLNVSVASAAAALGGIADVTNDVTQATDKSVSMLNLLGTTAKFGDASNELAVWIMHSGALVQLQGQNLTNAERLFNYGNVNVMRDFAGRLIVQSDIPQLAEGGKFKVLGLTQGGIYIGQNNDFNSNQETRNGKENIVTSYQAEWSYNLGLKGFAWDKAKGEAPVNAQLINSKNWKRTATSHKDLAGVILVAAQ